MSLLYLADHHVFRSLAGPESGQGCLTLKVFGDGIERFIDLLRLDFNAQQFFTGSQVF